MTNEPQKDDLDTILRALHDEQVTIREQASERLHAYVISASSKGLNAPHIEGPTLEDWDRAYIQQLQDIRIVEALQTAMEDSSARVRRHAASLLGSVTTTEAQEALLRHLHDDPADPVRVACVFALGTHPYTPRKVQGLIAALHDPSDQVVSLACLSLGKAEHPQALEPLHSILSHTSFKIRFYACEALVRLKSVDLEVVNLLEELNQQPEVQRLNEMQQKKNEMISRGDPLGITEPQARAQTCQAILEQARRLLYP
jgi:HEAT repeat protein